MGYSCESRLFLRGVRVRAIVNVYTARNGRWSVAAVVTGTVTGVLLVASVTLYSIYRLVWLENIRAYSDPRPTSPFSALQHFY